MEKTGKTSPKTVRTFNDTLGEWVDALESVKDTWLVLFLDGALFFGGVVDPESGGSMIVLRNTEGHPTYVARGCVAGFSVVPAPSQP